MLRHQQLGEILKMMNDPEIISFGGGNPASETFPVEQLKRISDDIFNTCPNSILRVLELLKVTEALKKQQ